MTGVSRNFYLNLFLLLLIIVLVSVFFFSVCITRGITIQWFLLPFLVLGGLELRAGMKNTKLRDYILPFFFSAGMFLCFFILFYWISFYNGNSDLKVPRGDYVFYARIASFISYTGVENNSLDYIDVNALGVIPYHYFDIWLTSFISSLGINIVKSLTLIVLPMLWSIIGVGIAALIQSTKTSTLGAKDLLFILLLATGGGFASLMPAFLAIEPYPGGLFNMPKLIPLALVLVTGWLMYRVSSMKMFYASIFLIIAIYTPAAPAVLGGTFLFWFYKYIRNREAKKQLFTFALYLVIASICILAFYKIFGGISLHTNDSVDLHEKLFTKSYWLRVLKISVGSSLQLLLVLPYFFFAFYLQNHIKSDQFLSDSLVWFSMIFVSGAFVWAITYPLVDSTQFFSNTAMVLFTLFPSVIGFAFLQKGVGGSNQGKGSRIVFATFIGVLSVSTLSNQFLFYPHRIATAYYNKAEVEVVKEYFKNELTSPSNDPVVIGCFFNQDDYSHILSYNPFLIDQMEFLNSITDKQFAYVHMNPEQIEIKVEPSEVEFVDDLLAAFKAAPYAQYAALKYKIGWADSSIKSSFIADKHIQYLAFNCKLGLSGLQMMNINFNSDSMNSVKIPRRNWFIVKKN